MRLREPWLTAPGTQALFTLFEEAGFQLYCVGGCVRNALLGAPVADIDMATNAKPDAVSRLADTAGHKVIPTGIDHGTVTVISDGTPYEITTFRNDVSTDGRRATVAFSDSLEEDAHRRDLTINALYADAHGAIVDTVGGLDDLQARRIRFIGDAATRIAEDYLRILRFFRFYAWYGNPNDGSFNGIDADGLAACADGADGLEGLSRERIGAEMCKLLSAPDPAPALGSMQQAGILARVMPGADTGALSVLIHLEQDLPPDWRRRVLALGGDNLKEAWRLSKQDAQTLDLMRADLEAGTSIAEMGYTHGAEHARNVAYALAASLQTPVSERLEDMIRTAIRAQFPITAADLMPQLQGAELGARLAQLRTRWIASDFTLTRDELLT